MFIRLNLQKLLKEQKSLVKAFDGPINFFSYYCLINM